MLLAFIIFKILIRAETSTIFGRNFLKMLRNTFTLSFLSVTWDFLELIQYHPLSDDF